MTIIVANPPILPGLIAAGFKPEHGAVYTWGDAIYNPDNIVVSEAVAAHEATHMRQQAEHGGPQQWWQRWIGDPAFRAEMEAQGYGIQYKHFCSSHKDRNDRARYLHIVCGHLASSAYRLSMPHLDAKAAILKRAA